jgi:hypothetical protein
MTRRLSHWSCWPSPRAAAPSSPSTTTTFTYDNAEVDCQLQGGHLASYETMQEQKDVESFLVDNVCGLCRRSLLRCMALHAPAPVAIPLPAAVPLVAGAPTHHACGLALLAGHPDRPVRLARRLLDWPAGRAQVPQLHLGRSHRGAPGLRLRQLGPHPGRPQRAHRFVQVWRRTQGPPQRSQPHQLRLGLNGLPAADALRLQAGRR